MKGANRLFIFTGVALALVAVLLGITMSSGGEKAPAQDSDKPEKINVVKAAVDFGPHTVLSTTDIIVEEVSSDTVPAGVATDTSLVIGQAYTLGAVKGDYLLTAYLQAPGLANQIAAGKRAFSLEVDSRQMMSGLVVEGDYIDLVFDARVDINRILAVQGVEIMEDGDYVLKEDDDNDDNNSENNDDNDDNQFIPGTEAAEYQGKPGTEFTITDSGQHLEPVTKLMIQDVKVLRVIEPGVKFDGQGQQVQGASETGQPAAEATGQLILEVTPQQAEAISFMQNNPDDQYTYHDVEVIVRALDDHEVASTSGITFQTLITDETWALPYPQPISAPEAREE